VGEHSNQLPAPKCAGLAGPCLTQQGERGINIRPPPKKKKPKKKKKKNEFEGVLSGVSRNGAETDAFRTTKRE
jgi:hypothetical protein